MAAYKLTGAACAVVATLIAGAAEASYVRNNPLNGTDPTGRDCVSSGGQTTCTTSDYKVTFGTPPGFSDPHSGQANYHYYSEPGQSPQAYQPTMSYVTNNPTPAAINNPATSSGAVNDATPGVGGLSPVNISPVRSYTTTNQLDGNPVVVNATLPGHPLDSGIVVREPMPGSGPTTTVNNWGEGNAGLQGPRSPVAGEINGVWRGAVPAPPATKTPYDVCASHPGAC